MTKHGIKDDKKLLFQSGVALLMVACFLWVSILVVPFLPLADPYKAGAVGLLLIVGEIAFWLGTVLTGRVFVERYKKYLNPKHWKRDKKNTKQ